MKENKVSVITVVRNDKSNIRSTINSVLSQTYKNIQYIIIDGESSDGTLDVIKEYTGQVDIFISELDKGVYDAMNKGTKLATGDWICYMNSGDRFTNNEILTNIFIDKKNEIIDKSIIYSDVIADYKVEVKKRKAKNLNSFFLGIPFSHQAHFVKASIAINKLFNLEYSISADYDFLYSVYNNNDKFYYHNSPIAIVDVTTGISKNVNLRLLYFDFFKITLKYSSKIKIAFLFVLIPLIYLYAYLLMSLKKINSYLISK